LDVHPYEDEEVPGHNRAHDTSVRSRLMPFNEKPRICIQVEQLEVRLVW